MMDSLQVGRVLLRDPQRVSIAAPAGDDDTYNIDVVLRETDLAETKAKRDLLRDQKGALVPIVYSTDPTINGFYELDDVDVNIDRADGALQGRGYIRVSIDAIRRGSYSQVELQSLITRVSAREDFLTTIRYWWGWPPAAQAVDAGSDTPTVITRPSAAGDLKVAVDVPAVNPTWSIDPALYYGGGVEITAGGHVRTGLDIPMDPTDWVLGNSCMEIRPRVYQGTSNGELEVRFHNGTDWGPWTAFQLDWAGTDKIPRWDFVSIVDYPGPEMGIIRLVHDAAEAPTETTAKHELDLNLRRCGVFVSAVYKFTTATGYTHGVAQVAGDPSTQPGGASYIRADSVDAHGDRWILGMPRTFTKTGSQIKLGTAANSMPFWIGAAVGDAANGTGNGPADLAEQYVGQVAETVVASDR
jgi:hypothetical protein